MFEVENSGESGAANGSGADDDRSAARRDYSISELAGEFEVSARTLRHYEAVGILAPRRDGTRRIYSRRDRARLALALRGRAVGFSLPEIRDMLDLYDLRDGQVTQLRVALDRFGERIDRLAEQRRRIDEAIADLERTRETIAGILRHKERAATAEGSRE